tara:strand:+ start:1419 stop:1586 length:168 start_codon:yes stop_codon:yes gene_type:complete
VGKDWKETQQDLTELNGDGNRERGRYGEDYSKEEKSTWNDSSVTVSLDKPKEKED